MMEKLLTLIIPTYNMEKYLRTCLDSLIIGDGLEKMEVLVINDGSKDASSAIAHEYEAKYPESFRVIDKENGNYGSCINRGLKEAKGKYIKILDADDHFDTSALKQFLKSIDTIDTDLILTDNTIFGDNDISKKYYGFDFPKEKNLNFLDYCSSDSAMVGIQMHNVTYKHDVFTRFNYRQTEGISYTDQEWIFAPMARVRTFTYLPLPLYKYLIGRKGQTISPEQAKRSSTHILKLVNSMLTMYQEAETTVPAMHNYLYFRLARQIKSLYRIFLAEVPGQELDGVAAFDQRLKQELPQLYDDCAKITMGPFIRIHYVSFWRSHNYRPQPRAFYTIFNSYSKTLFWLKRVLHVNNV